MGGKGRRRREKNYQAAHGGGHSRLPPPPDPTSLDAVPSKLRKIMSFVGSARRQFDGVKRNTGNGIDKGIHSGEGTNSMTAGMKRKRNDQSLMAQNSEHGDKVPETSTHEKKKKKKRKNNKAEDLRFEALGEHGAVSQRKERKKKRLEERKKKHKRPRAKEDDDFPRHEEIKFGDIVQAPPKLIDVPKAFNKILDASRERLRLQAVDAYRKRKGWSSRPGVQLPPPVTSSSF